MILILKFAWPFPIKTNCIQRCDSILRNETFSFGLSVVVLGALYSSPFAKSREFTIQRHIEIFMGFLVFLERVKLSSPRGIRFRKPVGIDRESPVEIDFVQLVDNFLTYKPTRLFPIRHGLDISSHLLYPDPE